MAGHGSPPRQDDHLLDLTGRTALVSVVDVGELGASLKGGLRAADGAGFEVEGA
jgi:hypothetical protein